MKLADGNIRSRDLQRRLLDAISMQTGLVLTTDTDVTPTVETSTTNKLILRDCLSNDLFFLKQRPLYLSSQAKEFTVDVVYWSTVICRKQYFPEIVGTLANGKHIFLDGEDYVLMVHKNGVHPCVRNASLSLVGRSLASLHAELQHYPDVDRGESIFGALGKFLCFARTHISGLDEIFTKLDNAIHELTSWDIANKQVVHGDIAPSNLIISYDSLVTFLDFDNMGVGSRYYDIASACLTFCHFRYVKNRSDLHHEQSVTLDTNRIEEFLRGYFHNPNVNAFDFEIFSKYFMVCWLEHLVLGALRGDFPVATSLELFKSMEKMSGALACLGRVD